MQEVKVELEDREYKLGETIDLTVVLNPRSDLDLREGRVELVCEETFRITHTARQFSTADTGRGPWHAPTNPRAPAGVATIQTTKERTESYVHSSAVFGKDTRLEAGQTQQYRVRFQVQPDSPYYSKEGTVKWRLVTTIDVVRGRNPKTRRTLKVAVD